MRSDSPRVPTCHDGRCQLSTITARSAEILYDLREAVGGDEGDKITRRHAAHLAKKHPTLNHLKSSLRKRCLLE